MNNIIYNGDEIIGRIDELEKYIREELKNQFDDWGIEPNEIIENTKELMGIIQEIRDNEQDNYDELIRITKHPMGNYNYKVLKECE